MGSQVLSPASTLSITEERALALLGQGLQPEVVATAIGVSKSAISQLLSQDEFSKLVAAARYENLAAHTQRDNKYDSLEDQILDRLKDSLSMIFDPMKLAKLLQIVNGAKRRGSGVQELPQGQATVLNLTMPTQIIQHFVKNINNQVVRAGAQDLVTMQSNSMNKLLAAHTSTATVPEVPHVQQSHSP